MTRALMTGIGNLRLVDAVRREVSEARFYQASFPELFGKAILSPSLVDDERRGECPNEDR